VELIKESYVDLFLVPWSRQNLLVLEDSWRYKNIEALVMALAECHKRPEATPRWVIVASRSIIFEYAFGNKCRKRGRAGNPIARFRQDYVHSRRHEDVEEAIINQAAAREAVSHFTKVKQKYIDPPFYVEEALVSEKAKQNALGWGKRDAFSAVGRLRRINGDSCSSHSVARSYRLVERSPRRFLPYHIHFLRLLKLSGPFRQPRGPHEFSDALLDGKRIRYFVKQRHRSAAQEINRAQEPVVRPEPAEVTMQSTQTARKSTTTGNDATNIQAKANEVTDGERAINAGNALALVDLLTIHLLSRKLPPAWLLRQILRYLLSLLSPNPEAPRGRLSSPASECREDLKHCVRWNVVREVRAYQDLWKAQQIVVDKRVGSQPPARDPNNPGKSLRTAFAYASRLLSGTSFEASPELIKKSYRKAQKDERLRDRFWIPLVYTCKPGPRELWTEKMGKEYAEIIAQIRDRSFARLRRIDLFGHGDQQNEGTE
jgi:hypothetical protein